ncbi:hypothetical protein J7M00_01780 [bacterium]|nr:hypothetical protein [bacterium]
MGIRDIIFEKIIERFLSQNFFQKKVLPLRKMSIVKSALFAVLKVFWKGVWGKASFSKEVSPKPSASPSTLRGALDVAPILVAQILPV